MQSHSSRFIAITWVKLITTVCDYIYFASLNVGLKHIFECN